MHLEIKIKSGIKPGRCYKVFIIKYLIIIKISGQNITCTKI